MRSELVPSELGHEAWAMRLTLRTKVKVASNHRYQGSVPAASIWPERQLHTGVMGLGGVGETGRGTSKALLWEGPRWRERCKERRTQDGVVEAEDLDLDAVGAS